MIKTLILVSMLSGSLSPKDSIGIETINGKVFVIHKVDEKETLYAISRRYRTTVDAIVQYNAGVDKGLEIGQILKVPYTAATKRPAGTEVHNVVEKETLFSISRKYGVSVDDLRKWNNLTNDALSIGQELVIKQGASEKTPVTTVATPRVESPSGDLHTVAAQETLYSISRQYGVTVEQLKSWNNLNDADLKIGQELKVREKSVSVPVQQQETERVREETVVVSTETPQEAKQEPEAVQETVVQPHTIRISESIANGSESVESGIAELIEGTEGNRKYLALHRTAPIGTILKVRNEMNNREVFVRVMGKLPDTALTNKVIIRISKSAHDRLGAIDQRFRVEVTYYK